jgi:hypothetical protein
MNLFTRTFLNERTTLVTLHFGDLDVTFILMSMTRSFILVTTDIIQQQGEEECQMYPDRDPTAALPVPGDECQMPVRVSAEEYLRPVTALPVVIAAGREDPTIGA